MHILESSFYQNQNLHLARTTIIELQHLTLHPVFPLNVPQLIPKFLEDVTGRGTTWNKKTA